MNKSKEILIEFVVQGSVVKATAVDPVTGMEASIVGPAHAGQTALAEAARRKLEYVLKKKG
ncbi:MAG TPA: hypothetical protein VG798_05715 [Rhizomicrobium sp.]|nr:hypothetical protein [Rhizomicrobium sp.]